MDQQLGGAHPAADVLENDFVRAVEGALYYALDVRPKRWVRVGHDHVKLPRFGDVIGKRRPPRQPG